MTKAHTENFTMNSLSKDSLRKYLLINTVSKLDQPTMQDLIDETDIPVASIKRQIKSIRDDFDLHIKFFRASSGSGVSGASGYYMITSWGIIDREEFLLRFSELDIPRKLEDLSER